MAMNPQIFDESSAFFDEMSIALEEHPITSDRQLMFLLHGIVMAVVSINSHLHNIPETYTLYSSSHLMKKPYGSQGTKKT